MIPSRTTHTSKRDNNFPLVRLLAAVFVFAGHMGPILGAESPTLGGIPIHKLGVGVLFLISGYLVTKSWLSDPDLLRFGIRRFFRLWPPFAVMILLMALVAGPLLSNLGVEGYFQHGGYWNYLKNLRFMIIYDLPGVFTDLPLANCVNGSLWTMPVEAVLYLVTPVLLTVFRVKDKGEHTFPVMALVTGFAVGADIYLRVFHPDGWVVVYGTELISSYHLVVFYVIGIFFTYEKSRKLLNLQAGCAAMCGMLLAQFSAEPVQYLITYLVFSYFVMSLVFAPQPLFRSLDRKLEISYGIYLYGYFFQQITVSLQDLHDWQFTYLQALVISAVPTVVAAFFSCLLVERPCLWLSRYLTGRLGSPGKQPHQK